MFHDAAAMQSEKPRVLGIEGGGTKTEWVLVADGVPLDRGVLPGSNLKLTSDESLAHLFSVLPRDVTHVGAFLAATATEEDRRRLRRLVEQAWPEARIAVGSDRDSAMATAFQDGDGIAVIAGTGAAVHGRKEGREAKAGGWGHVLGDRGGGYDLARQALRLVLTRYDLEQKITPLAERILRDLALNTLRELAEWAMQADKMSIAQLAPAVFAAARQGEAEMLEVLQAGAGGAGGFHARGRSAARFHRCAGATRRRPLCASRGLRGALQIPVEHAAAGGAGGVVRGIGGDGGSVAGGPGGWEAEAGVRNQESGVRGVSW